MPNPSTRPGSQSKKGSGPNAAKNGGSKSTGPRGTGAKKGAKKTAATTRFAERQARKEEEARLARQERNKRYAFVTIGLVIAVVAVLLIVKFAGGGSSTSSTADQPSPPGGTPIPAATLAKLSSVPLSTLRSAPTTGILTTPQSASGKALTTDGKPQLLYIGAEYCPHCAAERWAMYVALTKFGTFDPEPGRIHSATQDGNIPTLTYYRTKYSSPYLAFNPVEVYTNYLNSSGNNYVALETPTEAELNLWQSGNGGSFPYVNFAGKAILPSAQYSFADLQGLTFDQVAAQVGNNATTAGADIDASANQLIKTICTTMTHDQPADVCS
ncbi:MAG TPA: DUF929 family protein [Acidimicrobiales bacterium]|nr:DUF929 family protein [Acidimicrobiales bacterium]